MLAITDQTAEPNLLIFFCETPWAPLPVGVEVNKCESNSTFFLIFRGKRRQVIHMVMYLI